MIPNKRLLQNRAEESGETAHTGNRLDTTRQNKAQARNTRGLEVEEPDVGRAAVRHQLGVDEAPDNDGEVGVKVMGPGLVRARAAEVVCDRARRRRRRRWMGREAVVVGGGGGGWWWVSGGYNRRGDPRAAEPNRW